MDPSSGRSPVVPSHGDCSDGAVTTPTGDHGAESFRIRVLECVGRIPAGRVMSYGDVAACAGTRAARAVGQILAQSDDGLPWHRVVRADGGMADSVRARQRRLLAAEGVPLEGDRVVMEWARWRPPAGLSGSGPL
jgi:methylated-DNA-protein-cysteine methyltransferase related protein